MKLVLVGSETRERRDGAEVDLWRRAGLKVRILLLVAGFNIIGAPAELNSSGLHFTAKGLNAVTCIGQDREFGRT